MEQWGLAKAAHETVQDAAAKVIDKFPVEMEEVINTLDKPLIIECAYPGWQPRMWPKESAYLHKPPGFVEGGVRYPAVPTSVEEQISELVKASKAGCACTHVHPRDPEHTFMSSDPKLLMQIYDGVFQETDVVTIQHTWNVPPGKPIDYISRAEVLLNAGQGNRYLQGAVVMWPPADSYTPDYIPQAQKAVEYFESHNVKVVNKVRGTYHVRNMKRALLDTGILQGRPIVVDHDMGHPFGWPMDQDPWMPMDMITSIMQTKQRIPGCAIAVSSGGRNWLPITMTAILCGVDYVRVGIEDCFWMYPHKNEIIARNMDCVLKTVEFCKLIGREIANAEQARSILGITKTF